MAPERGLSAIKIAAEAIAAMRLGRVDDETTANLGLIQGGRALNIVPNEVIVCGECRSRDNAKLERQIQHMVQCFESAVERASVTLEGHRFNASLEYNVRTEYEAMNLPDDTPIVRKVIEAARRAGRVVRTGSNRRRVRRQHLNRRGMVVANLGTGMRDIHTVREWLDVKDMVSTAEVTVELIRLQAGG